MEEGILGVDDMIEIIDILIKENVELYIMFIVEFFIVFKVWK